MKIIFRRFENVKKENCVPWGTCGESKWRDQFIPQLKIDYFNPVVENWTPECQAEEIKQRQECDFVLYVITPYMRGVYSIAEIVDDSNKRPEKEIFCILKSERNGLDFAVFTEVEWKSLNAVKDMVKNNGAKVFEKIEEVAEYLNRSK